MSKKKMVGKSMSAGDTGPLTQGLKKGKDVTAPGGVEKIFKPHKGRRK